jgi:hypothetical protein
MWLIPALLTNSPTVPFHRNSVTNQDNGAHHVSAIDTRLVEPAHPGATDLIVPLPLGRERGPGHQVLVRVRAIPGPDDPQALASGLAMPYGGERAAEYLTSQRSHRGEGGKAWRADGTDRAPLPVPLC